MDSMAYTNNFIQPMAYSSAYGTYPSLGGMLPPPPINFSGGADSYAINQPQVDSFYSNTNTTPYVPPVPQEKSFLEKHWWKLLLGAGAVALGAIALKGKFFAKEKPISFEKVQQNFAEIFRQKDLTKEQTEAMLKNYQEIFKIEDKNTFIDKLFHQVKKDYGYENLNINYTLIEGKHVDDTKAIGGFKPLNAKCKELGNGMSELTEVHGDGVMRFAKEKSKESLFDTIMHEFQHCKQHELGYRTDKEKFIQAVLNYRMPKTELVEERAMYKKGIEEIYGPVWDKLPKINSGTKEHELGMKYIDNIENYISGGQPGYYDQIMEKEAYSIGDKAKDIYKFITAKSN